LIRKRKATPHVTATDAAGEVDSKRDLQVTTPLHE
jgi:hypothetical protein